MHSMTKTTFQLKFDTDSKISYVEKVQDELTKNHRETDQHIITGFMPQLKNEDGSVHKMCPVRSFENYINKLHPENISLWQTPIPKFTQLQQDIWYKNETVGHNTHEKFMSKLATKCNLSQHYTNHCIRVTSVTNLCSTGQFSAKQIMEVSVHKSIQSLGIYHRVRANEKLMMGMSLTYSILHPQEANKIRNADQAR